jgi:uncharacterized membrane protein
MNQKKRIIFGLIFLVVSMIVISIIRINPSSVTPIQSTESKQAGILVALAKGMILNQEISAAKDYLTGVSFVFTHGGRNNTNQNTFLVLDTNYQILAKQTFSSSILKEGDYNLIEFEKPIYLGKGKKVYLSLFSIDGSEDNAASPLFNPNDSIGNFFTTRLNPDDVIASIKNNQTRFHGSLMLKTFETNYDQFWLIKIFLYLTVVIITSLIIWSDKLSHWLRQKTIRPEYAYMAVAFPFALMFLVITPPYSVPDEGTHFKFSYSVSEFGFLGKVKTYPASIGKMDSSFIFLTFFAGEKLKPDDLLKRFSMKIEPEKRNTLYATDYTLPYIPQAIGVFIGTLFSSSLLTVMYFGRFFNLLFAVLIIFFSIRLIPPPFKLLLMLLALMPKTLFLFGSLSYDCITISLSFFAIALFFYYAYSCNREITLIDLAIMAFTVFMLLLVKPPYFILGALFFIIPPVKFGKLYKFIWIAIGIAVTGIVFFKVIPTVNTYLASSREKEKTEMAGASSITGNNLSSQDSAKLAQTIFYPDKQIKTILADPPAYLKLIFKSGFDYYRTYIMKSFVGLLGYIDVELPDLLTYSYLFLILFTALLISEKKIRINISMKALFVILLIIMFIVVETAMFLYATRPGRDRVFGVQGRYFIPMAPLFFMLFYNRYINPKLNLLFSLRRKEYIQTKPKAKPIILEEIQTQERLFDKYFYLFLVIYSVFALVYAVYLTIIRYYY